MLMFIWDYADLAWSLFIKNKWLTISSLFSLYLIYWFFSVINYEIFKNERVKKIHVQEAFKGNAFRTVLFSLLIDFLYAYSNYIPIICNINELLLGFVVFITTISMYAPINVTSINQLNKKISRNYYFISFFIYIFIIVSLLHKIFSVFWSLPYLTILSIIIFYIFKNKSYMCFYVKYSLVPIKSDNHDNSINQDASVKPSKHESKNNSNTNNYEPGNYRDRINKWRDEDNKHIDLTSNDNSIGYIDDDKATLSNNPRPHRNPSRRRKKHNIDLTKKVNNQNPSSNTKEEKHNISIEKSSQKNADICISNGRKTKINLTKKIVTQPDSARHLGLDGKNIYQQALSLYQERDPKSAKYFFDAASLGHIDAQIEFAILCIKGEFVEKNPSLALSFLQKARGKQHPRAEFVLGLLYKNGVGVEKNDKTAFQLFVDSAKLGNLDALYNVAVCYQNGVGVERNVDRANMLYDVLKKRGYKK